MNLLEKYNMSNKDWQSVSELSADELARYDVLRIQDQIETGNPQNKFYNQEVLKEIGNRAYKECTRSGSQCTKPDKVYKYAMNIADKITTRNKQPTCNTTFNLYKQHLDNLLSVKLGGVPSDSEYSSYDKSWNCGYASHPGYSTNGKLFNSGKYCPNSKCYAQPKCTGNCSTLPTLTFYQGGGLVGTDGKVSSQLTGEKGMKDIFQDALKNTNEEMNEEEHEEEPVEEEPVEENNDEEPLDEENDNNNDEPTNEEEKPTKKEKKKSKKPKTTDENDGTTDDIKPVDGVVSDLPPAQEESNAIGWVILAVIIVACIIGGAAYYFINHKNNSPYGSYNISQYNY